MDKVIIESPFVNSLFKCPLCNELIHSATVINECLHRFCKLCITNYFVKNNNKTCPICQIILINPLQTLKSDLTFQRLSYKIFQREIACKSSRLTTNESTSIQIDTKINVYLEYWNISLDLFPMESSMRLEKCYLECIANTPLISIEKFLRIKYSIPTKLKIDFFYQSFLLNTNNERLIDIYYCFDQVNSSLDIRFIVSPYGYQAILKRIHQSKRPLPLQIEVLTSINNSSLSSTSSIDSTLKVKICRSQNSKNDWFIPQSTSSIELPDLINSCKKISLKKKSKSLSSRRRIRFIPTMVKVPPSIFDCLSNKKYQSNEMIIGNFQDNITDTFEVKKSVPSYIPEYSLFDSGPLDLSLK